MSTPESFIYEYGLPPQQALCLDLLNSTWREEDRVSQPGWLEHLFARHGMSPPGALDATMLAQFQALREVLYTLIQASLHAFPPAAETIGALNAYLDVAPSVRHLTWSEEQYHLTDLPVYRDWNGVLGQIAQTGAHLLVSGRAHIKQCANPECRWLYYDHSPNQRRRWCEDACANRMRVRQFRARHQIASSLSRPDKTTHG